MVDLNKMSELQISLIAIGIVVIMVVVLFNWMQHRRFRRSAEKAFGQKPEDVLLRTGMAAGAPVEEEDRIEPQLGNESTLEFHADPIIPPTDVAQPVADLRPEPRLESIRPDPDPGPEPAGLSEQVAAAARRDPVDKVDGVDTLSGTDTGVDYVVEIHAATVLPDSSLTEVLQRKFDFNKPVRWLGQRERGAGWEDISAETTGARGYIALRGCLQLADRAGPVSELSLAEFRDLAKNLAMRAKAEVDCPDIRGAHARAVFLDEFCAEVDVMIGINIISMDNSVFTGAKIQVMAESSGFKLGTEGMFHYYDESGVALFSLGNFEPAPFLHSSMRALTTHGITFLLDVSRVANGEIIFGQMVHVARAFADALGGIMVDDNRVPLTENGIRKIKQQLSAIQSVMQARNIPAGSKVAMRLFA
ncbi:ZipA-like protein with FtsZ-binding domain [Nitrosospira sp. Nsp2]|nr:ZipA-like protein with FtsZ-binding domain [Nitrosospira sp. Nsp2]